MICLRAPVFHTQAFPNNFLSERRYVLMVISSQIREAILRAIEYYGNSSQFAKAIGVAHSTVFFWLSGKTSSISGKVWQSRVRPILSPFMGHPPVPTYGLPRDCGDFSLYPAFREPGSAYTATASKTPVIPFSVLKNFDPATEKCAAFVSRNKYAEAEFASASGKDCFAVRLEDDLPDVFLRGTDLLINIDEAPADGCCVIASIRGAAEVAVGRYYRSGNTITIADLRTGEHLYHWDCSVSFGFALWIYPVFEAKLDFTGSVAGTDQGSR